MGIVETNIDILNALAAAIPDLPEGIIKLELTLEVDRPPYLAMTVNVVQAVEGLRKVTKPIRQYRLVPISEPIYDVSDLASTSREFVAQREEPEAA